MLSAFTVNLMFQSIDSDGDSMVNDYGTHHAVNSDKISRSTQFWDIERLLIQISRTQSLYFAWRDW
jgi:hypothetical protein